MSGAWRIYLAVGAVVAAAYFFAPKGLGHHAIYDTIGASSIIAILLGIRRHRPANALPWYLFAYGNLAFVVGDGACPTTSACPRSRTATTAARAWVEENKRGLMRVSFVF